MIVVSNDFKMAMKQPIKELDAYIELSDNDKITSADDLVQIKISCDSGMCKTAMRKLEAKYLGEHNLLGQWVHVGYGVKLSTGTFEYLDYGSFLVTEITTAKDTGVTTLVGYDKMINAMKEYSPLDSGYPIDLYTYAQKLCKACDLELSNSSFSVHGDWQITQELWDNISGITYRDILVQIAQVTASTCIITNDNKVYFKQINNTGEQLTYDNMLKLKLEPLYGEINSVVLSRTPAEDNIYMRDEESIEINGLTEFKIENNEIIDKDRDNAMTPIYNALHGISYYPFETTTEGLGWYEIADSFDIVNDTGDVFSTALFNFSVTVDGGIKEILKTVAETKTQTQYQYATSIEKRVKSTEIITDKQNQKITLLSESVEENEDKIAQIELANEQIEQTVASNKIASDNDKQELLQKFDNYAPTSEITRVENKVTQLQTDTYTKTQIDTKLVDGSVTKLKSTTLLADDDGLTVDKSDSKTKSNLDADGLTILDKTGSTNDVLLRAQYDEVKGETVVETKNLYVQKYLTVAETGRLEKYTRADGKVGVGGFYVGG